MSKTSESIISVFKTVTIEPVIFLFILGNYILLGSQVPTNILMYKICFYEMNHTEHICENLGDESNKAIEELVQIETNNFQMTAQWIINVPGIIFSLYAGPLSDQFGRKPLIMFPIIGYVISAIGGIINYAFLEYLPLEFFYIDTIPAFFGGLVVYYLGQYGYGASVTEPEERAHRIARLDGTEYVATMIGTLLSPVISKHIGYFGNYGLNGALALTAVVYLKFVVEEPVKRKEEKDDSSQTDSKLSRFLFTFFVTPLIDMKVLISRKRSNLLMFLIFLQLIIYCVYIFALNSNMSLMYLYMLIKFDGFTSTDFAYFSVTLNVCSIICLIVIMPIVSGKLNVSDSLLLTFISVAETLGYVLSPFTSNLTLFYLCQILSTIGNCKFPIGRSLLSKYCDPEEVGKMFSIQSILISLAFMISNPIVRQLYNKTIENFPGAFLLLNASVLLLAGCGNLFIYSKRKHVEVNGVVSGQEVYTKM